jgi:hypothetical protein
LQRLAGDLMSQEIRLDRIDRSHPVRHTYPLPRVQVRLTSRLGRVEHSSAPAPVNETDNLREARGVIYSALLGGGVWMLIGLITWLIAR